MSRLVERLGLSKSATTRNVQLLSFRTDERKGGYDLVLTVPDDGDGRARSILLTPKGRRIWATLKHIMED